MATWPVTRRPPVASARRTTGSTVAGQHPAGRGVEAHQAAELVDGGDEVAGRGVQARQQQVAEGVALDVGAGEAVVEGAGQRAGAVVGGHGLDAPAHVAGGRHVRAPSRRRPVDPPSSAVATTAVVRPA